MFTGSISENRMTIGLPPDIRQFIYDRANAGGQRPQEYLRHILRNWYESETAIQRLREAARATV